jgi:hypothetical protein
MVTDHIRSINTVATNTILLYKTRDMYNMSFLLKVEVKDVKNPIQATFKDSQLIIIALAKVHQEVGIRKNATDVIT